MKKLNKIIMVLSLILLVMFSGCGQNDMESDNKVDDKGNDVVITNDSSGDEPVSQDDSGLDENIIEDEEVEIGELI